MLSKSKILIIGLIFALLPLGVRASTIKPFPVAPHNDTQIEWWYLFTHLTTKSNHHDAVVISFFRFLDPTSQSSTDRKTAASQIQDHYMLCGITDEGTGEHTNYSLADKNTLSFMHSMAMLAQLSGKTMPGMQKMIDSAAKGQFPPPTKLIKGDCSVKDISSFRASYGSVASLKAVLGKQNTYQLTFNAKDGNSYSLVFAGQKTPMYVGGDGNTGVVKHDDMKYVSLTRCNVTGTISSGGKSESTTGDGWFDHQWGSSWTPTAVGWDWFGIQLSDGRDILLFRQRHISDGSIFAPMATIEDADGNLTVTHNVTFTPSYSDLWQSPDTKVTYPLGWGINLPDQNLYLEIAPAIPNQELHALGNTGGAIWEGTVNVKASTIVGGPAPKGVHRVDNIIRHIDGKGYMELVGYGADSVKATLPTAPPAGN